jgi:hypothetical protein
MWSCVDAPSDLLSETCAGCACFFVRELLLLCAFVLWTDAASKPPTAQASYNGYTLQPLAVFPLHPCYFGRSSRTCSTPQTLHNPLLNCTRGKLIADLLILYNVYIGYVGSTGAAQVRATLQ